MNKQWSVVSGRWSEGDRIAAAPLAHCLPATDRRPPTTDHSRAAFTLVELLIVISIIGLLSSMVLFALASAQESARVAKTQSTIDKIHALIMQKYESYRTRRVPITIPPGTSPRAAAVYRLDALRELMRMEMPDRYSDIIDPPKTRSIAGVGTSPLMSVPAVTLAYRSLLVGTRTTQFENAECLYLLVTRGLSDPDVLEQFAPDEIGDTDGDGMREFLDGWGRPINFLRWAPGFSSPLHPWSVNPKDALGSINSNKAYPTAHDPFDPMRYYKPSAGDPFYDPNKSPEQQVYPPLYPLIYSPGPDHISDIQDGGGSPPMRYSATSPPNNPYATVAGGLLGAPTDLDSAFGPADKIDNSVDNITNHDAGLR